MALRDDLVYRAMKHVERRIGRINMEHDGGPAWLIQVRTAMRVAVLPWGNAERVAAIVLGSMLEVVASRPHSGTTAERVAREKARISARFGPAIARMVEKYSAPSVIDPIEDATAGEIEARNFAHFQSEPPWIQRARLMAEMDAMRAMTDGADADERKAMAGEVRRFRMAMSATLDDAVLDSESAVQSDAIEAAAQVEIDTINAGPIEP